MMDWKNKTELTAINVINAFAAAFLFVSPWLFGFSGEQTAAWNACITGLVIAGLALAATVKLQEWEEWANLVLGLWVAISPWVLGFSGIAAATWSHVVAGLVVAVFAAVELWMIHQSPRTAT